MQVRLYFPSIFLLQYVDAPTIEDLKKDVREHKASLLRDFLKSSDNDMHTCVCVPRSLKIIYSKIRNKIHGKVLGRDVVLYFRKEDPITLEPDWEEEYDLVFELDPDILRYFKIRRYCVIDRILWTHMIFKLYFEVYSRFGDKIKEFNRYLEDVANRCYYISYEVDKALNKNPLSIHPWNVCSVLNVRYPAQLDGVISKIPFLTRTGVFQLGIMLALTDEEFVDSLGLVLSDEFKESNEIKIEEFFEYYDKRLNATIEEIKSILEGTDTPVSWLREKLKEKGAITLLDIMQWAELGVFSYKELLGALHELIRKGEVINTGEKFVFRFS